MYKLLKLFFNRIKLQDEYNRQVNNVLQQWDSDIEKTKEQEEKLTVSILIITCNS